MFGTQGENTVGLTGADLEEEALLVLIRREQVSRGASEKSDGIGSDFLFKSTAALLEQFQQTELELELDSSDSDDNVASDDNDNEIGAITNTVALESGEDDTLAGMGVGTTSSISKRRKIQRNVVIKVTTLWAGHISKTLDAVMDAHGRTKLRGISNDGEISMVVTKPSRVSASSNTRTIEPLFVRWHNPDEFEGRVVRVDEQNRIVWSPATLFGKPIPTQVFDPSGFDILVSAVGAKCLKQRGEARDSLPPTIVQFAHFINMLSISWNEDFRCMSRIQGAVV